MRSKEMRICRHNKLCRFTSKNEIRNSSIYSMSSAVFIIKFIARLNFTGEKIKMCTRGLIYFVLTDHQNELRKNWIIFFSFLPVFVEPNF